MRQIIRLTFYSANTLSSESPANRFTNLVDQKPIFSPPFGINLPFLSIQTSSVFLISFALHLRALPNSQITFTHPFIEGGFIERFKGFADFMAHLLAKNLSSPVLSNHLIVVNKQIKRKGNIYEF